MRKTNLSRMLQEKFGDPIGSYAGDAPAGVPSVDESCPTCGMMPTDVSLDVDGCSCGGVCPACQMMAPAVDEPCGCMNEGSGICSECGLDEAMCECGGSIHVEAKKKGPTKATTKKILRGTKTFKEKMKKVSGWADDPGAAAAWMMHKATGRWPSEK